MQWNTIIFKNIDSDVFVGRFNGVDIRFDPSQEKPLPSHVADHLFNQLCEKMIKRDPKTDVNRVDVLGVEIKTTIDENSLSFKEQLEKHQKDFELWGEEKRKKELFRKDKAIKIAEKHV